MKTFLMLLTIQSMFLSMHLSSEPHDLCKSMYCIAESSEFLNMPIIDDGIYLELKYLEGVASKNKDDEVKKVVTK